MMDTNKIYAEQIANEYSIKNESKVIALKKLDRKAKLPANIFAYSFGLIMSLILGLGMCLSMNVICDGKFIMIGIIIGIIGIIGVGLAMGICIIVTSTLKQIELNTAITMLGIGMTCLAIYLLKNKDNKK